MFAHKLSFSSLNASGMTVNFFSFSVNIVADLFILWDCDCEKIKRINLVFYAQLTITVISGQEKMNVERIFSPL